MTPTTPFQPLAGVRVLDLSRVLAGPVCSMVLADLGADVIKVERPGRGDDTREWGPPFIESMGGMSAYFASVNRNKRSLTLDMTQPAGREVLNKLIERSHVLLENYLPASVAKMGLTPEQLHAMNPRLIVCTISGFGRTGPWSQRPGYDFVVQALSGLMSITGEPDGQPMKIGVALTDVLTGLYAAVSILAALVEGGGGSAESGGPGSQIAEAAETQSVPHRSGSRPASECAASGARGSTPTPGFASSGFLLSSSFSRLSPARHLELSLLDCTLASLVNVAQAYLVTGQRPVRYGNAHPQIVPYECFATADGYIVLAVGNDEQWQRFCAAASRDDLGRDERFVSNPLRVANRGQLVAELRGLIGLRTTREWVDTLEPAQVPHAPVLGVNEAFAHPQVLAREMVVETDGGLKLVASPVRVQGGRSVPPVPPPQLGQHTDEILSDLGYTSEAIRVLHAQGVS